ncbi:hypothetical protein ACHAWU_005459 [Discostella pseudostelligera]|uniref:YchJ-like middle NTF2-like domain-containing protein n=1 Tax=Discostella pseudostelligera TaxID=259834 RepID=A0ABD3MVQ1_9STRA
MGKSGFRITLLGLISFSSKMMTFGLSPSQSLAFFTAPTQTSNNRSSIILRAKKTSTQKKSGSKKSKYTSTSGFGGAAVEDCPCGTGLGYMKCCGKLHRDGKAYADATAEQVVRARYSAYAKREVDFIVGSTHPLNKNFISDIEHWKETIRMNCYDNFELTNCEIVDETYECVGDHEIAKVKFVAKMIQVDSREKTAFMETSLFERAGKHIANGAWLYKEGVIESAPGMPLVEEIDVDKNESEQ